MTGMIEDELAVRSLTQEGATAQEGEAARRQDGSRVTTSRRSPSRMATGRRISCRSPFVTEAQDFVFHGKTGRARPIWPSRSGWHA